MSTKLTLSIKEKVIEEAKEYAKRSGKSLSSIVEEYLKSLSSRNTSKKNKDLSKLVRELKGSVELPSNFVSYKATLEDALIEKYLK